jgi:hypothetical protein
MFQCNQCHTEYGGIRGITADRCPRCAAQDDAPTRGHGDRDLAMATSAAAWRSPQLSASSWSGPTAPLVGPIAQLDRAFRF